MCIVSFKFRSHYFVQHLGVLKHVVTKECMILSLNLIWDDFQFGPEQNNELEFVS